jgi:hypothetical protein
MEKQTKFIIVIVVLILIVSGIGVCFGFSTQKPGKLDDFSKCLTNSGAQLYGTFWCSHCANQKKIFGSSFKYVSYVECSTPDGNDQLPICKENNIEGYPSWIFGDGSISIGEMSLAELSKKTQCPLPIN